MPRRNPVILIAVLALLTAVPAGAVALNPPAGAPVVTGRALAAELKPWVGEPTLVSGTSRYDAGEWIANDFVYDDYGADTTPGGQPNVVSLAPTSGDFRYPTGLGNAADIVEVRVRVAPGDTDLQVRVLLQTISDPAAVALRVEADGVESVVTAANAAVDAGENTVTFTLPGAAAGADSVALNIGAGLHDGSGGLRAPVPGSASAQPAAFTSGGPTTARLFDLAFNTHAIEGRGGAWNEDVQSDKLQAGDLAPFTQTVDLDALRAEAHTDLPVQPGYAVHLFRSVQDLGEGMGTAFPQYRGAWQPYAVWVPEGYEPGTPAPLLLYMHSLSVHHNQYRGGAASPPSYPRMYEQFEDAIGAVVVTPLGRGPDGWYEDAGLVDTMEVWADALRRFTIDPERVHVGGYSMGGYGTYRLTTMMPDVFASAVSVVGPPANGVWPYPAPPTGGEANPDNTHPQLEGSRHVPIWITHGVQDELVPFTSVVHQAQRIGELGHEYRFALHPVGDHFAFVFQDDWSREAGWLAAHPARRTDPQRVTLRVRPASWVTASNPAAAALLAQLRALTAEVGARLDGGYWVGGVAVAPGVDVTGAVDLTSGGVTRTQAGVATVAAPGVDGPSPYVLTGQDQVFAESAATDTLSGSLQGVTSVTVDVGRAGLSDSPVVSVTSSTPATIRFVRDGVQVGQAQVG